MPAHGRARERRRAPRQSAVRGRAISYRSDPFLEDDALIDIADALIVSTDGVISAFGPYRETVSRLPEGLAVAHYPNSLICAGFIDLHAHYVQTGIIGASGSSLLDWLDRQAYPEERRFADDAYAQAVARIYFDELLRNGTTTAVTFCSAHPGSVDAFFAESLRRGTRMIGGKVLMDRGAPRSLLDTAETGYRDSRALLDRWHGRGRNLYAVSPRFAPTSSPAELEVAGALWRESPGSFLHSHVAENLPELDWVRSLFPDCAGPVDVYDRYGLLGPRAVLAHGVHLSGRELSRIGASGAALTHCPTSNLFLGSGLFRLAEAKRGRYPVHVGLGTDVGAGTSFSMLATMGEAYKVAQLIGRPVSAIQLLYLATLGGARALGLEEKLGSLEVGKEADFVVLDPAATPLLAYRSARTDSSEELMLLLALMGDDRAVLASYVAGVPAHSRGSAQ